MTRWQRIPFTCILALALLVPMSRLTPVAHAAGQAGSYGTLSYFECTPNTENASLCPPYYQRIVNPFFATVDSAGNFTHNASILVEASAPNTGPLCDPSLFSTPFTGSCVVTDSGSGFIKQGSAGYPDFWVAEETAAFHTNPPVTIHDPFPPYPIDIGTPAVPLTVMTQQVLGLSSTPPPGVTAFTVVARSDGPNPPAVAMALPTVRIGQGSSGSFLVAFLSNQPGQGVVLFGTGPGCSGLVETATRDYFSGALAHTVLVTGNDLSGEIGDVGIQAGQTYWYETVTVTATGTQVDDNAGKCHSVTIPSG